MLMPRLISVLSIAACASVIVVSDSRSVARADQAVPAATVVKVEMSDLVSHVQVTGTIVANHIFEVHAQVSDLEIREVLAEVGDTVKKGDLLVRLDDSRLQADLLQAKAELASAQASVQRARGQINSARTSRDAANSALDRKQQLYKRGNTSVAALDQATSDMAVAAAELVSAFAELQVTQAQLEESRSRLDLAELNLKRAEVRAHAAGLIVERGAIQGAIIVVGAKPLFRIIRDGRVEVEVEVFESDLATIKQGDQADLKVAGTRDVVGWVRLVAPMVDSQTRLGSVWIRIDADQDLRTGLSAGGTITTNRHTGLTVPVTAVQTDAQGDFVQAVIDGVVKRRDIVTGVQLGNLREVKSGLKEGDAVLARAGAFFRDGDAVRAISAVKAGPDSASAQ